MTSFARNFRNPDLTFRQSSLSRGFALETFTRHDVVIRLAATSIQFLDNDFIQYFFLFTRRARVLESNE